MTATGEYSPEQGAARGPYIQTYSGKFFYVNDPRPEEIDVQDIAHALSQNCRFNGHVPHYYSVAEHSVIVSRMVPPEDALWGLLHDASEAYLPDVPRPFKGELVNFKEIENRILMAIIENFGLTWPMPKSVHYVDSHIVATEANQLWGRTLDWTKHFDSMPSVNVYSWNSDRAKKEFLARFEELSAC
ncbi:MAG: hypothetical protein UY48_C0053G0004 [Candidatus Gottesmanbacteria bacterium GW2011_GWB1_49_7]|uniref:Phosphohydrolase n=1 Tax=Candidatus Gottesmanbacteria bacterium GW2011_GWB1_49_7 TaxID=1618448 RepID=A0A0G1Y4J6_9BACT|nr:MAG: hypothetical protein UY48_C0053G0004 [Candidatus Gottesmanbacteria bacterium GW2011_GWB1_49_7]